MWVSNHTFLLKIIAKDILLEHFYDVVLSIGEQYGRLSEMRRYKACQPYTTTKFKQSFASEQFLMLYNDLTQILGARPLFNSS